MFGGDGPANFRKSISESICLQEVCVKQRDAWPGWLEGKHSVSFGMSWKATNAQNVTLYPSGSPAGGLLAVGSKLFGWVQTPERAVR